MSSALESMLAKYNPQTATDTENALKEIIQEMTLAGLARANFFDKAAFCGGTALRIFYGLPRFSEDLDFTLLRVDPAFSLKTYLDSVTQVLESFGLDVEVAHANKSVRTDVDSAFVKANTKILFLKIETAKRFASNVQANQKLTIKFEVDTTPPVGFETEVKVLPPPITAGVNILTLPSLFSGKLHAVLFRKWKNRVKGRDFYDLLWYLGHRTPFNIQYLENKIRDTGEWNKDKKMTDLDIRELLINKIESVDFQSAGQDVIKFIRDPAEVKVWSKDLFLAAVKNLKSE